MYSNNNLLITLGAIGCLGVLALLLNFGVLSGNWRWDDTAILLHLHQYSIIDDFVNPGVWQQFSPANLTPWLILSFELDLIIFGVRPELFYLHQLVALTAAAAALYFCLTLWISRKFAFFGAFLFLLGAPSLLVMQQLMTRHYVEGMVFCLLCLSCYVLFLRQSKPMLLVASGLFYILAITAKEIYVPLVLLLPFLPESNLRHRLKAMLPLLIIVSAYTLWRGHMLDSFTGGYVDSSEYISASFVGDIVSSFSRFPALLFGGFWFVFVLLYLLLAGCYSAVCRSRLLTSAVVVLLVLLPLVPLVRSPGIVIADRYLFLLWLVLSFSVAFFSDRLSVKFREQKKPGLLRTVHVTAVVFMLISLSHGLNVRQAVANTAVEFDAQAEFIWQNHDQIAFVPSDNLLTSFWFVTSLIEFKSRLLAGETSPVPIVDTIYLDATVSSLLEYGHDCRCMREVVEAIPARLATWRNRTQPDAPLSLSFEYQGGYFAWQFGPYEHGTYQVVSDVIGVIPVPTSGRLRVTLAEDTPFYLRYTAPEGWITYSTEQRVQPDSPLISWQRE